MSTLSSDSLLSRLGRWWRCRVMGRHPDTDVYIGYGPLTGVSADVCKSCRHIVHWSRKS